MNGVEILNSETIYETFLPVWWILVAMIVGFVCLMMTIYFAVEGKILPCILFIILVVGCSILFVCACVPNENSIHHTEYKVTIDDSVSMNEFLDKYEILDQEGKIYTVKERE